MVLENSKGNWSKTKVGTLLVGIAAVVGTIGAMLNGAVDTMTGIQSLVTEVGVVLALFGLRDIPLLNKLK